MPKFTKACADASGEQSHEFHSSDTPSIYSIKYDTLANSTASVRLSMGIRFNSITIDKDSTIHHAWLKVFIDGIGGDHYKPSIDIYCNDVDDAAAFTATDGTVTSAATTTATTAWTDDYAAVEIWVTSPDFASSVQEVIDRGSWSSGNDLSVLLIARTTPTNDTFSVHGASNSSGNAPELHVLYTAAGAKGSHEVLMY